MNPHLSGRLAWGYRAAYLVAIAYFAMLVARYYHPDFGFTEFAQFGSTHNEQAAPLLKAVPRHIQQNSAGYDGQFYAQLALYPAANDPELFSALDNPAYRSRRVFFAWTAYALGLGNPPWIVQAYCIQNLLFWLFFAIVLLHWFPPNHWQNLLRYCFCLYALGFAQSVSVALLDGPATVLIALGILLIERQRSGLGAIAIAAATLGKETSALAAYSLIRNPSRQPRDWARDGGLAALALLPFAAWLAYLALVVKSPSEPFGQSNFGLPFVGWINQFLFTLKEAGETDLDGIVFANLAALGSIAVQAAWILLHPQPKIPWWRCGAAFAALAIVLGDAVWEGHIGAAPRSLLPLAIAFNVLLPRNIKSLPWLLIGNLSVLLTFGILVPNTAHTGQHVAGQVQLAYDAETQAYRSLEATEGWHPLERKSGSYRRWSPGQSAFSYHNPQPHPVQAQLHFSLRSLTPRRIDLQLNGVPLRSLQADAANSVPYAVPFELAPGLNTIAFSSDQPPDRAPPDTRDLSFALLDFELELLPPTPPR